MGIIHLRASLKTISKLADSNRVSKKHSKKRHDAETQAIGSPSDGNGEKKACANVEAEQAAPPELAIALPENAGNSQSSTATEFLSGIDSLRQRNDEPDGGDPITGKVLLGKYEILELLGEGGMSRVYKARQLLTKKIVAFKMLHKHLSAKPQMLRRFQAEAQASHHLSHQHIITTYDFGITEENQPCLVMDLVEGRTLAEVIKTWGKLDPHRCIMIFIQALEALEHAHDHGVLHRDLKPSNFMLALVNDNPDFVKLVDFGIAKILPEAGINSMQLTQSGEIFGSPLYMSPEQCLGRMTDARSDIYSMGCLMYEALTGVPPLVGENMLETMHKQVSEIPAGLTGLKTDVRLARRLEEIVLKAMAKEPEARYQSARDLRIELEETREQWQVGLPIVARISRSWSRFSRTMQNRLGKNWQAKLASLTAFSLISVSYLFWLYSMFKPGSSPSEAERMIPWKSVQPDLNVAITEGRKVNPVWEEAETAGLKEFARVISKLSINPSANFRQLMINGTTHLKHKDYERASLYFSQAIIDSKEIMMQDSLDCGFANTADAFCLLTLSEIRDRQTLIRKAHERAKRAAKIYSMNSQERFLPLPLMLQAETAQRLTPVNNKEVKDCYQTIMFELVNNILETNTIAERNPDAPITRFDWDKVNLKAYQAVLSSLGTYLYKTDDSLQAFLTPWSVSALPEPRQEVPGGPSRAGIKEWVLLNGKAVPKVFIVKSDIFTEYRVDAIDSFKLLRDLCDKQYGHDTISLPGTLAGYNVGCAQKKLAQALKADAVKLLLEGKSKEAWQRWELARQYFTQARDEFKSAFGRFEQLRGSNESWAAYALFNLSDVQIELGDLAKGLNTRSDAAAIYSQRSKQI